MRAVSTLLVSLMAISSALWLCRSIQKQYSVPKSIVAKYALWKSQFGKLYVTPQEDQYRLSVFGSNVDTIARLNTRYDAYLEKTGQQPLKEPMFVLQQDSDLSQEEFKILKTGLIFPEQQTIDPLFDISKQDTTTSLEQARYMIRIRDQGQCSSCWAFSAAATLEKMYFDLNGVQVDLSQQYLVDCSTVNQGCIGGWATKAYRWVNDFDMALANMYPYRAVQGLCRRSSLPANQFIGFLGKITSTSWDWSWQAVEKVAYGGVNAGALVSASGGFRFVNKNDDIFDPVAINECQMGTDHGVNLIGTGVSSKGTRFVLIQNSWGTDWGNGGIKRFKPCGSSLHGVPSTITHPYKNLE